MDFAPKNAARTYAPSWLVIPVSKGCEGISLSLAICRAVLGRKGRSDSLSALGMNVDRGSFAGVPEIVRYEWTQQYSQILVEIILYDNSHLADFTHLASVKT